MTETNAYRQRVVDGLIAAEVPELLATGIADILVEAGFNRHSPSGLPLDFKLA